MTDLTKLSDFNREIREREDTFEHHAKEHPNEFAMCLECGQSHHVTCFCNDCNACLIAQDTRFTDSGQEYIPCKCGRKYVL
jgi:hypothetical protein